MFIGVLPSQAKTASHAAMPAWSDVQERRTRSAHAAWHACASRGNQCFPRKANPVVINDGQRTALRCLRSCTHHLVHDEPCQRRMPRQPGSPAAETAVPIAPLKFDTLHPVRHFTERHVHYIGAPPRRREACPPAGNSLEKIALHCIPYLPKICLTRPSSATLLRSLQAHVVWHSKLRWTLIGLTQCHGFFGQTP